MLFEVKVYFAVQIESDAYSSSKGTGTDLLAYNPQEGYQKFWIALSQGNRKFFSVLTGNRLRPKQTYVSVYASGMGQADSHPPYKPILRRNYAYSVVQAGFAL